MSARKKRPGRGLPRWAAAVLGCAAGALLLCLSWARPGQGQQAGPGSAPPLSAAPAFLPPLSTAPPASVAPEEDPIGSETTLKEDFTLDTLPPYAGQPWITVGDGVPDFEEDDLAGGAFESYSELDELGRCGAAFACVGTETMPTEGRGEIWMVRPSGWQSVKYDFVDGESLYNRCHLIGFQLTGENDNEENLITGTRYMNVSGMLPYEDRVAAYVRKTKGHVLYRVTPMYREEDLVCTGVRMEGLSVEDGGEGVCFDVFCYNCQPGVEIEYADGSSRIDEDDPVFAGEVRDFVLNTNKRKIHLPDCSGAASISEKNRKEYTGTKEMLIVQGYSPCGQCHP